LINTNTALRGIHLFSFDHFLRISSLFSKEISENLRTKGHFQCKQRVPQRKSVPNLNDRIHRIHRTNGMASGALFLNNTNSSAA